MRVPSSAFAPAPVGSVSRPLAGRYGLRSPSRRIWRTSLPFKNIGPTRVRPSMTYEGFAAPMEPCGQLLATTTVLRN